MILGMGIICIYIICNIIIIVIDNTLLLAAVSISNSNTVSCISVTTLIFNVNLIIRNIIIVIVHNDPVLTPSPRPILLYILLHMAFVLLIDNLHRAFYVHF